MRCPPPLPSAVTGTVAANEDDGEDDDGVLGASYTTRGHLGIESEVERGGAMANPVAVQAAAEKLGIRMLSTEVM